MMKEETTIKTAEELFQLIADLAIDYDGYTDVKGLKSLIDDLRGIAIKGVRLCNGESIVKIHKELFSRSNRWRNPIDPVAEAEKQGR